MMAIEGLAEDKDYDTLKPLLLQEWSKYIITVESHGGKVTQELTAVRKQVEVDDKARALAYHRKYSDSQVLDDVTAICGTCNVLQTVQPGKGDNPPDKSNKSLAGKSDDKTAFDKKCLRCGRAWHTLEECPSSKCMSCAKLSAQQHQDRRCPLFKYVLRYYRANGDFPTKQSFFADYSVPEAIFKLSFPKAAKYPAKSGDKVPSPVKDGKGGRGNNNGRGNGGGRGNAPRPNSPARAPAASASAPQPTSC
jgi:hypothetical protein